MKNVNFQISKFSGAYLEVKFCSAIFEKIEKACFDENGPQILIHCVQKKTMILPHIIQYDTAYTM